MVVFFKTKCNIDREADCRVSQSVYSVDCLNCHDDPQVTRPSVYYGTSGRQLHIRQLEHLNDVRLMRRSNALFKHSINEHPTEQPNFVSKPIQSGFKYNLDRFIFESIKIQHGNLDNNINCLNSRAEWGHRGLPRLQINHD